MVVDLVFSCLTDKLINGDSSGTKIYFINSFTMNSEYSYLLEFAALALYTNTT